MRSNVTWTAVAMTIVLISGTSSIALPGLDLSTSVDDPEPFHLPAYLSPVGEGSKGVKTQPTTRPPSTQQPASHSITAGQNGDAFSNYLIKSLTQMDANTLKTLSNIINLELNKQVPSHQIQGQAQSQTYDKVNVQSPPEATHIGQYPHISHGITSESSSSQYKPSTMAGASQMKQEGQGYSHSNNLSNKPLGLNGGQAPAFSQQTVDPSRNQQPQMGTSVSQSQFNPGQMTASSMGGGNGNTVQGISNSMFQTAVSGGRPSASNMEVDTSFDPNRLMASIEAETSQYNPNAFMAKQNYITANQWNFAKQNQVPQNTQYVNQVQTDNSAVEQQKKPNIMGTTQLNFESDIMMTALGIKGQKFTFNPDKINSFGSNGFQPGLYPQSSGNRKLPKNMFNADTVNKMLMSHGVEPNHQTKQQPTKDQASQVVHKSVYNPDTFNHPAVHTVPNTYLQFIGNEGSATVQSSVNNHIGNGKSEQSIQSETPSRQQNGNEFHTHLLSPISDMGSTSSINNTLQSVKFNPDQTNAAQRQFDPEILYKSLFVGGGRHTLPSTHMTISLRKSARDENGTDAAEINTPKPQTTSSNSKDSGQSTTLSSTVTSTKQPETSVTSTTTATTTGADGLMFNPDNVNAGIAQMMNFSPGSLMMGYNQIQAGQNTNMANAAYNPNQINQMGEFQSVVSPMMAALMGESGGESNIGSQTASQPNHDQSQSISVMFNPADVNHAKMSFDINQQMGFNENSGNAMFDPMKINVLTNKNLNKSVGATNKNNFFSSNGMNMMDNSVFTGMFDPNKVNQAPMADMKVNKHQNSSASSSMMNYMSTFLGVGSVGGAGGSVFGGSFNPSEVNTAVFNPNDVNNARMNFDPANMLDRNPGYDSEKASQTNFDPTKINDIHMNFQPPFIHVDKNKDVNSTSNAFSQYNSKFTPGQLSPNGNAMVFNPTEINQAKMHFSAVDIFNSTDIGNSIVSQGSSLFSPQVPNKNSNIAMPVFDPVAVNNMQINFLPNSALGAYQSSLTTIGTKPKPSTTSMSTPTSPTTTTRQKTSITAPSSVSSPNSTDVN